MGKKRLGELVKIAKGEDRTVKEYEQASGVDAAVISKIISGKYVPQKSKVYEALTSAKAAPRGGVTYERLLEAAEYSESYKEGIRAGLAASEAAAVAMSGLSKLMFPMAPIGALGAALASAKWSLEQKEDGEKEREACKAINDIQRFVATSMGVIYGCMAQKGICFKPDAKREIGFLEAGFETYVSIDDEKISEYVFCHLYLNEEERKVQSLIEAVSKRMIERLIFLNESERRKVSIVTNSEESYNYLLGFKGALSYKGNLSIVLLDVDNVRIGREDYLTFYPSYETEEVLRIM